VRAHPPVTDGVKGSWLSLSSDGYLCVWRTAVTEGRDWSCTAQHWGPLRQ